MMASTVVAALPEGLTARPLTIADAQGVVEAVAAEELVDLGEVDISLEDVLSDWQRPSYDITASTVGVFDGDRLVAYGDVAGPDHAYSAVHPDHQGRGIGTAIAAWIRETARTRGSTRIGSQVPEGSAADRLMADLGYRVRWTAWDLELPDGVEITPYPLPDGFVLRDATPARPRGCLDPDRGRLPRVVGPAPTPDRGLRLLGLGTARLRAVEPPAAREPRR